MSGILAVRFEGAKILHDSFNLPDTSAMSIVAAVQMVLIRALVPICVEIAAMVLPWHATDADWQGRPRRNGPVPRHRGGGARAKHIDASASRGRATLDWVDPNSESIWRTGRRINPSPSRDDRCPDRPHRRFQCRQNAALWQPASPQETGRAGSWSAWRRSLFFIFHVGSGQNPRMGRLERKKSRFQDALAVQDEFPSAMSPSDMRPIVFTIRREKAAGRRTLAAAKCGTTGSDGQPRQLAAEVACDAEGSCGPHGVRPR